jgi:hypothetical protein
MGKGEEGGKDIRKEEKKAEQNMRAAGEGGKGGGIKYV